jgi:hypothetical protein
VLLWLYRWITGRLVTSEEPIWDLVIQISSADQINSYNIQYICKFLYYNVLLTKKLYSCMSSLRVTQKLNEIKNI